MNNQKSRNHRQVSVHIPAATVFKVLSITTLVAGLAYLAVILAPLLLTIAIAAFLSIAADPGIRWLEHRFKVGRGSAVIAFMLGLTVVLAVAIAVFVPPLITQGQKLVKEAPAAVDKVRHNDRIRSIDSRYHVVNKATKQAETLPGKVSRQLGSVVATLLAGLFGTFTILFLMVLFLLGGGQLTTSIARLVPQLAERRWWSIVQDSYRSIGAYVSGTLLIALIAGFAMLIALVALQLPFALPLALWMALLDIVPMIGATIGAVPALIVAFASGGLIDGIIMLIFIVLYQQGENAVIQPAILGRTVALPPLIIFIAVLAGSQTLGIVGALLAIPLAGIIQIVTRELVLVETDAAPTLPPIAPSEAPDAPDLSLEPGT